jgi:hypothetical protein
MMNARPNRIRRAVVYASLATLLGVVSLTLSQCTMVGDNLTGVGLNRATPTRCTKVCSDAYQILHEQEQKLHKTNQELCQALEPESLKGPCLVAEDARHTAKMADLIAGQDACDAACHSQGTGSAG